MSRLLISIYLLVFVCTVKVHAAQDWQLVTTPDFNIYYTKSSASVLHTADSLVSLELYRVQKKLNFYTGQPVDVFLVSDEFAVSFEDGLSVYQEQGAIQLLRPGITLSIHSSPTEFKRKFAIDLAGILIEEMMYGGDFQDKIRSANLVNLPSWVIPGLQEYLASGWSVESDNMLRYLHDYYSLKNFDKLPSKYNHIKGASFWHYLDHKHGENAAPTLLYMARLTRKFNAAVYYAYQTTMSDIFLDWQDYYNKAYQADQMKPNPVGGLELDADRLYEVYVVGENDFYTLEDALWGVSLFHYTDGIKTRLLTLSMEERPIGKFRNAIQLSKSGDIQIGVNIGNGSRVYRLDNDTKNQIELNIPISYVTKYNNHVYVLSSDLDESTLFELKGGNVSQVGKIPGYCNSFDVLRGEVVFVSASDTCWNVILAQIEGWELNTKYSSQSKIKQVVFSDTRSVLFNDIESGIWNGKVLFFDSVKSSYVTNYRSSIVYHQHDQSVFAELVDRGEHSTLHITDHIPSSEFYTYDTLYPASLYFGQETSVGETPKNLKILPDSLASFTFQSPVHPSIDFKLSNYDSLQQVVRQLSQGDTFQKAPNIFQPSRIVAKLSNRPTNGHLTSFEGEYVTLLPRKLNLSVDLSFKNQYNTIEFGLGYLGLLQNGAQDISFYANVPKGLFADFYHRRRVDFQKESRTAFSTNVISVGQHKKIRTFLSLSNKASFRYSRKTPLIINSESLQQKAESFALLEFNPSVNFSLSPFNSEFTTTLSTPVLYNLTTAEGSISPKIDAKYSHLVNTWWSWSIACSGMSSIGTSPVYYILGGANNDINIDNSAQLFSDFKTASMYHNIYGIRGFGSNHRNGTTAATAVLESRLKLLSIAVKRPIASSFFADMQLIPFADLGTAFYGQDIFNAANVINKREIVSSTGAIATEVISFKNPLVFSLGAGLETTLLGYTVRADYGWGFEDQKFKEPILHLRLGRSL